VRRHTWRLLLTARAPPCSEGELRALLLRNATVSLQLDTGPVRSFPFSLGDE
jgi:hypothetical protein